MVHRKNWLEQCQEGVRLLHYHYVLRLPIAMQGRTFLYGLLFELETAPEATSTRRSYLNKVSSASRACLLRSMYRKGGCKSEGEVPEINLWETRIEKETRGVFQKTSK